MSLNGRLARGLKWYARNRDADGNLLPSVANDENKMKDVNTYLEHKKKVEEEAAEKTKSKGKK